MEEFANQAQKILDSRLVLTIIGAILFEFGFCHKQYRTFSWKSVLDLFLMAVGLQFIFK